MSSIIFCIFGGFLVFYLFLCVLLLFFNGFGSKIDPFIPLNVRVNTHTLSVCLCAKVCVLPLQCMVFSPRRRL